MGVNWSGAHASGYDISADDVVRNVQAVADLGGPVRDTIIQPEEFVVAASFSALIGRIGRAG